VSGRRFQDHLILRAQHVAQKLRGEQRERGTGIFLRHLLVALARLNEAQVADVAGRRHLRGGDALTLELLGEFFLGGNPLAADQFQDLALTVAFGHKLISLSRCLAAASAAATVFGPVPPGTSRERMPFLGSSSAAKSPVNSGANRRISSAVQSAGRLPGANALQYEAPHNLVRLVERACRREPGLRRESVATTQLSSAERRAFGCIQPHTVDHHARHFELSPARLVGGFEQGTLSSCMSRL
jgi:hypothetical protein